MSTAQQDYENFVGWLHDPARAAPEDVRRMANIVLGHFTRVSGTSRQASQRSVTLAALARAELEATPSEQPAAAGGALQAAWSWKSLNSLSIGPFRGFKNNEAFNLDRRIVMFYGPNGSGKTSLCEALEFALLGAVDEADAKRIAPERYYTNVHAGLFVPPALTAKDAGGAVVPVLADADAYRFCFVEKNRIDAFSRISARPTGQKNDLIAALFGMERFSDFVGHFNESMDGQLKLVAEKKRELDTKRAALNQDIAQVADDANAIARFTAQEEAYATTVGQGLDCAKLTQLVGSDNAPGRLHELNLKLGEAAPWIYGVSSEKLQTAYKTADDAQHELDIALQKLGQQTAQVSFSELYNAVLKFREDADKCPACDTPLWGERAVFTNPFAKAEAGLAQLKELGALQASHARAVRARDTASHALAAALADFAQRVGATAQGEAPIQRYLATPGVDLSRAWWTDGYAAAEGGKCMAVLALEWAQDLEKLDQAAAQAAAQRQQLVQERDRLEAAKTRIALFMQTRQQHGQQIAAAKARIEAFEVANAALIAEAEREAPGVERDLRIKHAYDGFIQRLRAYKEQLPGTLMAGLNVLAMELYNEFNCRDLNDDKLSALNLPVTGDGRIEIAFRGRPERKVDALQVLSEGHIRCLGLAILLAKALSIEAPVIVFDDAINAIDHEHRQGIRETIFQSERFAGTQVLVTCHSNEFIKDIENNVHAAVARKYVLRHHIGDYHPRVVRDAPSQNYLAIAQAALDVEDHRSALGAMRQALEFQTGRLWHWLGKCQVGVISVKLDRAGGDPSLRNLCDSLVKQLKSTPTFAHVDKEPARESLGFITGVPEETLAWVCLNKGTHEEPDRDDFDMGVVQDIHHHLVALAALELRPR